MSYYVVALERGDPLARDQEFHLIGSALAEQSVARIMAELRRTGDRSLLEGIGRAETYAFAEVMPGQEHTLPAWAAAHLPTPEYERFEKVYFLNELALRMYEDGGVEFEVTKVIADDELPRGCGRGLSAPYLPEEK